MKTIHEEETGSFRLRILDRHGAFTGLIFDHENTRKLQIDGNTPQEVLRRLRDELARLNQHYVGFSGARARFLQRFPEGFQARAYAAHEYDYKIAAKILLDRTVPVEQAVSGAGFGKAILSVVNATNLLSPFEKPRLRDVLLGPEGDRFVRAAARFALGETGDALRDMARALTPQQIARWPAVTYLPFLWRPDLHMFLRPTVTQNFAASVGHRFLSDYQPVRLDIEVYESLLNLAEKTRSEIRDLQPRNQIDIQSFIWVVEKHPAHPIQLELFDPLPQLA